MEGKVGGVQQNVWIGLHQTKNNPTKGMRGVMYKSCQIGEARQRQNVGGWEHHESRQQNEKGGKGASKEGVGTAEISEKKRTPLGKIILSQKHQVGDDNGTRRTKKE